MANCMHSKYAMKLYAFVTLVGITMGIFCINIWHKGAAKGQLPAHGIEQCVSFSHATIHHHTTTSTSNPLLVSPSPVKPEDFESIQQYHAEERRWCEQKIVNATEVNWCPCIPPGLQGRVLVNMVDNSDWDRIADAVGNDILTGGEWKPEDCLSHTRLAIVIPCRDREHHLRILLRHLIPILKRQLVHFRVFVVDQRHPAIFNKAATMNIGFLEAAKRFSFDCVIFHDVDMILEDDRPLMTCSPEARHYARSVDRFDYQLYPTFGGVVSITPKLFRKINGYPLRYFGWGGEDDDMWSRVNKISSIYKPPPAISRYSTIPHGDDITNQKNPERHALNRAAFAKNGSFEGLSDLNYKVNDVQMAPLFTRIEADINITKLSSYPSHPNVQYKRTAGKCLDNDVIMASFGVSWNSCRFLCDSLPNKPCFGFSYVHGICTIIRAACSLTLRENQWTFVRDGQFKSEGR